MSSLHVLVVDDHRADQYLIAEAVRESGLGTRLHFCFEANEALRYLRRQGGFGEAVRPDLIVLDLNLGGMSGLELLAEIRADSALETIPVVIFSSGCSESDQRRVGSFPRAYYRVKPGDLDGFFSVVREMEGLGHSLGQAPELRA